MRRGDKSDRSCVSFLYGAAKGLPDPVICCQNDGRQGGFVVSDSHFPLQRVRRRHLDDRLPDINAAIGTTIAISSHDTIRLRSTFYSEPSRKFHGLTRLTRRRSLGNRLLFSMLESFGLSTGN